MTFSALSLLLVSPDLYQRSALPFPAAQPFVSANVMSTPFSSATSSNSCSSSTSLGVTAGQAFDTAALAFFGGLRVPASLLAGSSLASLFAMVQQAKATKTLSRTERVALWVYHSSALGTLCLSLLTVITTTVGSTLLLLGRFDVSQYGDVYHFLRGNFLMEFVVSRWSFLCSVQLFLLAIMNRVLLEFDLLKPGRRTISLLVAAAMMGLIAHCLSYINTTLNCWPNLLYMTKQVVELVLDRALAQRYPLQIISLGCFAVALVSSIKLTLSQLRLERASSMPSP
jgi:hypothetical protein